MPVSTPSGLIVPTLTDAPNVPAAMANLAATLDPKVIPSFATSAARAAAITAPADGQITYQRDTKRYERFSTEVAGGTWVAIPAVGTCTFGGTLPIATTAQIAIGSTGTVGWTAGTMRGGMSAANTGTGSAGSGVKVGRSGLYTVKGGVSIDNTSTVNRRGVWPAVQSLGVGAFVAVGTAYRQIIAAAPGGTSVSVAVQDLDLNAGDVVSLVPYQDSGVSMNVTAGFITLTLQGM